ncbi:hypothetical protein DSO57_1018646 [Entomophthora muscae]|uniref:Uncharacterized protein n=1 Tax=Entomophthora muscae TaxID=34485 RepID=A0ACC2SH09_9FUNG|nr:hypothetical protein DSO57_1018646 [Entomophthora muscae]
MFAFPPTSRVSFPWWYWAIFLGALMRLDSGSQELDSDGYPTQETSTASTSHSGVCCRTLGGGLEPSVWCASGGPRLAVSLEM